MLSGSTADRIGRRRVFKAGLLLFTIGSVLCSLAPNLESLVAFRMVQAVGGSMLNPVAMSIITNTFTDPRERARAIGVWGGVVGISMAAGPIVGGVLVESVGWRSIFWLNLPVGLLALFLTWRYIPESRAPKPRRPDPVGQLLVIALLGSLTYAIIEAPGAGWDSPQIVAFVVIALAALAGLLLYEPRRAEPLIDLRFFRSAPFSGATVIAVVGVRRAQRVPLPQHPVPPKRPRSERAERRALHAADGRAHLRLRAAVGAAGRQPGAASFPADRGDRDDHQRGAVRGLRRASAPRPCCSPDTSCSASASAW